VRTPDRYIDKVERGADPVGGSEELSHAAQAHEALVLALRTADGVPAEHLPDAPDLAGLVRRSDRRAVLTPRGRLMANAVAMHLI
jgi:coproporphyrinogen III oxidase-like Fe-S oxidoreductase